jgi:hypothetical protein
MGRGSLTGRHYSRSVSQSCLCGPAQKKTTRLRPGGVVEAAGLEPASASAPSARFYERSSRFNFAYLDGPGRRRGASPLSVPPVPRARTRRVSPLADTGSRAVGHPGRWAALLKQQQPVPRRFRRVCLGAGVLRVSSKLGSSRWTRTAHVETGRPQEIIILPFRRGLAICEPRTASGGGAPLRRAQSRARRCGGRSRAACRTASCGWRRRARALCCRLWSRAAGG